MALKKPSDLFDRRNTSQVKISEDHGIQNDQETSLNLFETFRNFSDKLENYRKNDEKIDTIFSEIDLLKEELEKSIRKEDLDQAMMSQLFVVENAISDVQKRIKGINKSELESVRTDIDKLNDIVSDFSENVLPKYKKLVLDTKTNIQEKYEELENVVENTVDNITEFVDQKYDELKNTISSINEETLNNILNEFNSLTNKVEELNDTEIPKYKKFIVETEKKVENKLVDYETKYKELEDTLLENVDHKILNVVEDFNSLTDRFENLNDTEIPKYKKFIVETEKKVENKIKEFNEKLENVNSIVFEKIKLVEGDKNELINTVNRKIIEIKEFIDNEVTLKKKIVDLEIEVLKNEKKIKDVEKYIQENYKDLITLREQVFEEINNIPIGNVEKNIRDIKRKVEYIESVYKNIKPEDIVKDVISESLSEPPSTKNKDPLTPLDKNFVTLDQLQEHYRLFINRIQQQLSTLGGGGETQLKYLDDIVGIATNPSIYDGQFLKYDHNLRKFVFSDITEFDLEVSEKNIVYVAKDGNDDNPGTLTGPKLTIKSAVENLPENSVVRIAPGTYFENNPITLPDNVTVMGHSLRETTVIPLNDDQDLFYVGNGNYVAEMSFRGSMPGKSVFSFDPVNERYIDQSPYIQNCTNFIPDSIGMKIDGNEAIGPLKSMVLDSYTQYNQGGIGVSITNEGYAQLVSLFTICDDIAVYCGSGAACDLTNSNSSFGNYGLVADGVSPKKFVGIVTTPAAENSDTFVFDLNVPEFNVVNADYNNETGRVKITVDQPHKFNVGMAVSIVGLAFTCPFENGFRLYPSGERGYVFNVETVAPGRYLDAADLIVANTQEIIDKSLAQVAVSYANTNFYFPGETETNERSRYYDATRLIQRNKQEIVDKSLASIAVGFPSGFTFPGDTNPNQRYYDASRLITLNKQEIVDKSLASVAIAHSDFYFPGDENVGLGSTTPRSRYYDAYRLIQRNRDVIVGAAWSATSSSYPQFNYTETKCRRDIGFFIDAVSTDVFTGGNSYARDFVLQYFNGTNPIGIAVSEREPSVYAFDQTRDLMKQAITNTLVGADYSDLTVTPDPLTGSNVDPLSCADVRSNIDNLVGIVTVSIGAGNTSSLPVNPNLGYFNLSVGIGTTVSPGGVKCARDLGFLVEALSTDVFTGGNKYTRDFTLQYFDNNGNPITNGLVGETAESVTAFNALRDFSKKAITNQLNYKNLFVSAGISSLGGGGSIIPVLPSGNPNSCTDVQYAIDTLVGIAVSVVGMGTTSLLSTFSENLGISTTNICARDIGYFVDAISTDIFTGGNKYSRDFTKQYFDENNNIIYLNGENIQSAYAFNSVRDYAKKAITNQLNYKELDISAGFSTYPNVGNFQPILPSGNPNACADVQSNINTLVGIVTNVIGVGTNGNISFLNTFSENSGTFTDGAKKCARDIGFIVNATVNDLIGYTNANIIDATKKYFNNDGTLNFLIGEEQESIVAFNAARDYMKLALNNQLNVKDLDVLAGISSIGGGGPIIPILPSGSPNACSDVRYTIDTNISILTTAINSASLSSVPTTVSLASTEFSLDVGIATQPHFYVPNTGTAKLNIVRPFDGQVAYFNELFYVVKTLNIVNGGSGYTDLPTITIDPPDTPWGIQAQASPNIENGVLVSVDMISNGRGYRVPPKVTISSGINTAVATAELVPEYYTVQKSTEIVNGITIVTFNENIPFNVGIGTEVSFFKQSRVLATGHSFEFIGAGTDIATALPFTGGVPIEDNETDDRNGGLVVYSSTNQSGNFKIGDGVTINQNTGSITGNSYTRSLFSTMTPFILSLGGF